MRDPRTILELILEKRGIKNPEDLEEYLSDKPSRTYDPFDMLGMREGVDLISKHLDAGNRICIYGDYDADGVTSICILHHVLSHVTDDISWYIPSRFEEGYGMNTGAVEKIAEDGVKLIITVDCGITSVEEVKRAQELGVDVIVTDHHAPAEVIPGCIVIDPKRDGETYPFDLLAGCGVAFKLAQAIQRDRDLPKSLVTDVLDLAGAGTIGDIVPLIDENRTIAKYGLRKLNEGKRTSMDALAKAISIESITSEALSYGIIPHINASGRMGSADDAVKLFLSEDPKIINDQVNKLIACNSSRRKAQEAAYEKCLDKVTGDEDIVVLSIDGMHEGIAGIVAGKLKETYNRPVLLATPTGDGTLKGTGRSISGIDIHSLMSRYSDLFIKFGGHKAACGFTIGSDEFSLLKEKIEGDVKDIFENNPSLKARKYPYDIEIHPSEIGFELVDMLKKMEPFGEGNPAPAFAIRSVKPMWPRYMGDSNQHVRFSASRDDSNVQCVLFRRADEYRDILEKGEPVDLMGSINDQVWNGQRRIQFIVEEIESGKQ